MNEREIVRMVHRQVDRLRKTGELRDITLSCPHCGGSRSGQARDGDACHCERERP